ncbi:LOW QUALITY PROTEIN: Protein of unknown function [Gryllus bimaculatus]|nr:LOW QUALITY PROTEIN: Protein of unknown function [Gryllus bimaculatus]
MCEKYTHNIVDVAVIALKYSTLNCMYNFSDKLCCTYNLHQNVNAPVLLHCVCSTFLYITYNTSLCLKLPIVCR